MKYNKLVLTALYSAILCLLSPWVIPVGAVPITFASFAIYLISAIGGVKTSVIAVGIYVLLGALGLPVFSGFAGGVQAIAGTTGGFIVGYIISAFVISILKDKLNLFLTFCIGTLPMYLLGTAWFAFLTKTNFVSAAAVCCLPFILTDAVKIALACVLIPRIKTALKGV